MHVNECKFFHVEHFFIYSGNSGHAYFLVLCIGQLTPYVYYNKTALFYTGQL